MNLNARLERLERAAMAANKAEVGVILVHEIDGRWDIPVLNFSGSIDTGQRLLESYPNSVVIIDNIPGRQENPMNTEPNQMELFKDNFL